MYSTFVYYLMDRFLASTFYQVCKTENLGFAPTLQEIGQNVVAGDENSTLTFFH